MSLKHGLLPLALALQRSLAVLLDTLLLSIGQGGSTGWQCISVSDGVRVGILLTLPISEVGEKLKYHPFWGSPLFYKAPPRQFQPPKCRLTPSKIQIVEGNFCAFLYKNCRLEVANLHFGGCQFTFWRVSIYILEAEIVLGVLYRKGVIPKKVGTLGSCEKFRKGVGGQRELARRNPSKTRDLGLFSVRFFLCPLSLRRMGTHF